MRVVSLAKRLAILADCDAGMGTQAVAKRHGVSGTFVRGLKQERRETGSVRAPRQRGPGRAPKIPRGRLQELVAADADATLAELRERLGITCSLSALWTVLHDLKITFKKKRSAPRNKTRMVQKLSRTASPCLEVLYRRVRSAHLGRLTGVCCRPTLPISVDRHRMAP